MDFFKSFMITANLIVMMMLYSSIMEVLRTNNQSLENDFKMERSLTLRDQANQHDIMSQNEQDARDRGKMMAAIMKNQAALEKLTDEMEKRHEPLSQRGAAELSQDQQMH